jgi:CHASE3 domain sensor protein
MSSILMIPVPPVKLARSAWARVAGLLLLGLLSAAALAFYGYQLHRVNDVLNSYKQTASQYQMRTEAIHRLSDMEAAFNRYLLDGNSANLGLLQSDKQRIDQLAQWDADAQHDQLLQGLVAAEQKWYGQAVQPMIEERRKLAAGQGLPEDFLAKYRAAPQDLQLVNLEMNTENAHRQAQQALRQAENQLRWLWLPYPLAGLLMVGVIALAIGAMKNVSYLKQAAESEGEDEDDEKDPPDSHEETK